VPRRAFGGVLAAAALLAFGGCGFIWTYDQAFPPEHLDFPRFDPPDSLAFRLPKPPPVEAVIMDADLYYLMHPKGEQEYLRAREQERAAAGHRARTPAALDSLGGGAGPGAGDVLGGEDSLRAAGGGAIGDSLAVPDSLLAVAASARDSLGAADSTAADTAAVGRPLPPIEIDLTPREERTLIRRTNIDLDMAESIMRILDDEGAKDAEVREQMESIRDFIQRSKDALARRHFQGAANLALKARSLAEDLYQGGS